jgi:hypothetical protein
MNKWRGTTNAAAADAADAAATVPDWVHDSNLRQARPTARSNVESVGEEQSELQ